MEQDRSIIKKVGLPIIYFVLWLTLVVFLFQLTDVFDLGDAGFRLMGEFVPLIAILILGFSFNKIFEKNRLKQRFYLDGKEMLEAFGLGIVWFFGAFLLYFLINSLTFEKVSVNLFVWLIALFLNTIMQEYMIRGFLYEYLSTYWNPVVAITTTTILFLLFHGGALESGLISTLNVITMSLFMTLLLEGTKNLIPCIIVHFVWNALGGLVFNLVNLAEDYPSLIKVSVTGSKLFTGGAIKLEGSVITLMMNSLLCFLVWRKYFRKS